jgi:serine protease Do
MKKNVSVKLFIATVLIAAVVGLIFGSLGGIYFGPWLDKTELVHIKTVPEVVKEVSPSVISVIISKYVAILEQEFYNPFGEDSPFQILIPRIVEKGKELKEVGGGSGFVVSADGLIVTNNHVVADKEAQYTVLTNDGQKYSAKVLSRDAKQDVAILKIEANNLMPVKMGNSNNLEIGETVIAIGNALGEFRNTVSAGIVSGLMRSITAGGAGFSEKLDEVIQTDAAINSGNSGGPLLNLYGEVIGINTAVATNAENIGFAIPINKIKQNIEDVKGKY